MCRMAGFIGDEMSPVSLLWGGTHSLYRQSYVPRELLSGHVNADGWGACWFTGNAAEEPSGKRYSDERPIWNAQEGRLLLEGIDGSTVMAAVRNTTPGIPNDRSGVPPLLRDGWAFTLNGYIAEFRPRFMRAFRSHLSDRLYGQLEGASDTETLFLWTLTLMEEGLSAGESLSQVIGSVTNAVRTEGVQAQLNVMLGSGSSLIAARASSTGESNSLYICDRRTEEAGLPQNGVWVASETLDGDDRWEAVPHQTMVIIPAGGDPVYRAIEV